jgi:serine/threonine protein kinase
MCNDTEKCYACVSLEHTGIPKKGCLRDEKWLRSITVPTHHSIFNSNLYIDLSTKKLTCLKNVYSGKFGYIDLARLEDEYGSKDVYVKRPIIPGKSLLYEACIQMLVYKSLKNIGFPTGAPKVVSIFRLRDNSVCFAMEQIKNSCTLDKYLESIPRENISNVIVDCLLQLCAMITYLNSYIGINHRDLKPSNFLIVEHETPIRKVLNIGSDILEIESKYSLTFIDFGFSCIGSIETCVSDISLSTVYSKKDPCPKEGRDLYLFISFLYIDYYDKLPQQLIHLFESWFDIPGTNLCKFIKKDREAARKWIYFITGDERITSFKTCPSNIVKDLQELI